MVEISTSILTVKEDDAIKTFYNLETAKTDYFHLDVMDGKFVRNSTTEIMLKNANIIKQISIIPIDVHLMVEDVKSYIDSYIPFKPNIITFHIEACKNEEEILNLINYIKANGIKVGIAIRPNTKISEVYKMLPLIHMILVMTVEPGYGGQKLISETIDKVKELRKYITDNYIDIDIEVDGGINSNNCEQLKANGANIIVAGTAIINSKDYKNIIQEIKGNS